MTRSTHTYNAKKFSLSFSLYEKIFFFCTLSVSGVGSSVPFHHHRVLASCHTHTHTRIQLQVILGTQAH